MTYYCDRCLSEHESPDFVCTECEGGPMTTMHERTAADVDAWLTTAARKIPPAARTISSADVGASTKLPSGAT